MKGAMMKPKRTELTKAQAARARKELDEAGYERSPVRGTYGGRGTSWTRHIKGNKLVFIHKSYMPLYTRGGTFRKPGDDSGYFMIEQERMSGL